MTKNYRNVIGEVYNKPWAIMPDKLEAICGVIEARLAGASPMSEAEMDAMALAGKAPKHQPGQSVAVLPLWGTLHHHGSLMTRYSGGTSTVSFCNEFKELLNDSSVGTIVIHANGPGGTVFGCQEAGDLIYNSRSQKKIVSMVDARAASATYWIASSAEEMYVTPSGEVGSIGVYMAHRDISKFEEKEGIKTTLIAIPSGKVMGNPYEPIPEAYLEKMSSDNEIYYRKFVSSVARNRGVSETTVRETFGGGGMVLAEEAVSRKMADAVKTFDQCISDILAGAGPEMSRRSSASRAREIELAKLS